MIQTSYKDDRGEVVELSVHDARYWEGPYHYEPFPKALYRITQPGQTEAEHRVVKSEREMTALGSGWFESPEDAKVHFEKLEADMARAAAESNAADTRLSAKAQAERLAHDRSTDEMVTDVPAPKKGWPKGKPRGPKAADTPVTE